MKTIPRIVESRVRHALDRQKSVLLLGPRQTGKTTLVEALKPDLLLNFLRPEVRQRYERAPQLLGAEVEALAPRTRASRRRGGSNLPPTSPRCRGRRFRSWRGA